ncbi:MAG: cadherin domain-containing protein [Cyclobacteriaceae bacterium]|nr:cadherin domain-containing protein [Cyclobacteriaceae bacterium HetDA_MAG_MS6]
MKFLYRIVVGILLVSSLATKAQIQQAEYFFEPDPGPGNGTSLTYTGTDSIEGSFSINTDGFAFGRSPVYFRAKQADGSWSVPSKVFFFVIDTTILVVPQVDRDVVAAEYFIDTDPGLGEGTSVIVNVADSVEGSQAIDIGEIGPGLHVVYFRTQQSDGLWSPPARVSFFVIVPVSEEVIFVDQSIVAAEYFFDNDPGPGKAIPLDIVRSDSVASKRSIRTDSLSSGPHKLIVRVQSAGGQWSIAAANDVFIQPVDCGGLSVDFDHTPVASGSPITLTALIENASLDAEILWDFGLDKFYEYDTVVVDTSFTMEGVYPVEVLVSEPGGCSVSAIKDLLVLDDFSNGLIADKGDSLLQGDTLTLTAPSGFSYLWNTGDTTQMISVTEEGEYFAWMSRSGVSFRSEAINLYLFDSVRVDAVQYDNTIGQSNGLIILEAIDTDGLPFTISWSTGKTEVNHIDSLAAGAYSVDISTALETKTLSFTLVDQAVPGVGEIITAEYYWDADPGIGNGTPIFGPTGDEIEFIVDVETDTLSAGAHDLFIRANQGNGLWSVPSRYVIYIQDSSSGGPVFPSGADIIYAEYSLDSIIAPGTGTPITITPGQEVDQDIALDVSSLSNGSHTLFVTTRDNDGIWSHAQGVAFDVCSSIPAPPTVQDYTLCKNQTFQSVAVVATESIISFWRIDEDGGLALLQESGSNTYFLNGIQEDTAIYVSQTSVEGCQSALARIDIDKVLFDVYAGPDGELPRRNTPIQLINIFPDTGVWTTTAYLTADGLFDTQISGLGTFEITYSVSQNSCDVTDTRVITVVEALLPDQTFMIAENALQGGLIGELMTANDQVSLTILSGNELGAVQLSGKTLTVADSALFDFELNQQFVLQVRAIDGLDIEESTITIDVQDVNEQPMIADEQFTLDQNSPNGTSVGSMVASDPDNDELTFQILSGNVNSEFSINSVSGEIIVAGASFLDFDTQPDYDLEIQVSDGTLSDTAKASIRITTLKRDSVALVDLFTDNGGSSWQGIQNWTTGDLASWTGLEIVGDRVTGLDLSGAGVTGNLPESFIDITGLVDIDLSNNEITGLPDISGFPVLNTLNLSDNRLPFAELLKNDGSYDFTYSPQKTLGIEVNDTIAAGSNRVLLANVAGEGNTYQWSFGGQSIAGATDSSYTIQALDFFTMGTYDVEVGNPALPELTIGVAPQTIIAETEIFGLVTKEDQTSLAAGEITVYRIRDLGNKYDSVTTVPVVDGSYEFEAVVLGDFILKVLPDESDNTVTQTHYISALDWLDADTLFLREQSEGINITMISNLGSIIGGGTGSVLGTVEEEFTESSGRHEARRRVRRAGCSLSKRRSSGRSEEDFYDLVAYTETDDEGRFSFGEIPDGDYRINIQFPGVPMDSTTFIEFTVGAGGTIEDNEFVLEAVVTDEGIQVELVEELGNPKPFLKDIVTYPNPTKGKLQLSYRVNRQVDNLEAVVYAISGLKMQQHDLNPKFGLQQVEINMEDLPSGLYLLVLSDSDKTFKQTLKITKE